jgi:hypothetical protein
VEEVERLRLLQRYTEPSRSELGLGEGGGETRVE